MPAETGAALLTELLRNEGETLRVYDDATGKPIVKGSTVVGNPTIGIGRCLSTNGITLAESRALNFADRTACWDELLPLLPWLATVSVRRQVVVLGLYFNTGLHNPEHFVRVGWPNFLEQMGAGQYALAAQNLLGSQPWATEVGPRSSRYAEAVRVG